MDWGSRGGMFIYEQMVFLYVISFLFIDRFENGVFCFLVSLFSQLGRIFEEKMLFLQKKSGKCFVVKKKAIPLHSLYNGNSATNDDRLFSSVGQST